VKRLASAVAILVLLGACSSSHHSSATTSTATSAPHSGPSSGGIPRQSACDQRTGAKTTGYLIGTLQMVVGVVPARPVQGTIVATDDVGRRCSVATGHNGTFEMDVLPNRYRVTGRSPTFEGGSVDCTAARSVVVEARLRISQGGPIAPPIEVVCNG
jgi:hypothetical protein